MKKFIIATLLTGLVCSVAPAQNYFDDKVFKKPVEYTVPYSNDSCIITDIAIDEGGTSITFEYKTGYIIGSYANYSLNCDAALVDVETGTRYPLLITSGNIENRPFESRITENYTSYKFKATFLPLPANVKKVNLTLEPGMGLSWTFNNINVSSVPRRETTDFNNLIVNPKTEATFPGVKVFQTVHTGNFTLVMLQYTSSKFIQFQWGDLSAIDPSTGTSYKVTVLGMPTYKDKNPLYLKAGNSDAGVFIIPDLPAGLSTINIVENKNISPKSHICVAETAICHISM